MKKILCLLLFALLANAAQSFGQVIAANPWQMISEQSVGSVNPTNRRIIPKKYLTARIEPQEMRDFLQNAPLWFTDEAKSKEVILALPMPDGSFEDFRIELAPVMHRDLQKKFPMIQAFAGVGITDPHAYVRFDMTQWGFHAMIMSPKHSDVFIDPYSTEDDRNYIVYFKKDFSKESDWTCATEGEELDIEGGTGDVAKRMAGDCILRNFSLALACTGEYAAFHGGTVAGAFAAMQTSMVRVNGVFEKDLSIHMDLVANNISLVYINAATDPYTNGSGSAMLSENQTTCDNVIGSANYDIGHVFSTGGGGVAYLGCVCNNSLKAGGVTGQASPVGDPFDIDYVAHEMGHQYGANHTQNNNCNRVASAAFEPGSASTIMGYAGICAPNVQNNSDAYFHAHSLLEIANEIASSGGGNSCSTNQTVNNAPTAGAGLDYTIPKSTPFVLTATGSDPNGDAITYCWEQMDNAVAMMPPVSTNTGGPTFRSLTGTTSPSRYFPNLAAVIANTTPTWEVLPSVGRTLNFRVTVRDNKTGGGCTAEDNTVITVNGTAGPFLVTAPNAAGISYPGLSTQTITWDVASTNLAPVNCANVAILLSLDGGNTYPITLAASTPNDGSHDVTIPDNQTTTARIMVRSVGNVFYDISNNNFAITAPLNDFTFDVTPNTLSICQPASAAFTVNIGWSGSFSGAVTLAATGIPAGATHSFSINPMTSPGTSLLTISNLPAGTFPITVSATGSTGTKSETVGLVVSSAVTSATSLTSPADASTGIALLPTFTWAALAGAFTYDLQVSTSNTFGNTAINQTGLAGTTYTATTALTANTQYFWRVRGVNACGNGDWSTVFSFTTLNITCTTFASTDVPKAISATGTPTVTSVLNLTALGTISDVNLVNLNISHTYINDLIVKLKSPANTERTMLSQICGSENNIITNLDDEATNNYGSWNCPPIQNLWYKPFQTLSQFDNENLNGTWTLTVQDVANQDGGTLNSWSLAVCYTPTTVPLAVTISSINVACNGGATGSATATATGGTGSYTYAWSNGATTAAISNLAAGTYTVTATSGSQTATASVTITQPTAVAVSIAPTNVACFGGSTGSATATATGGTGSKTYLWSNGATTATISNLAAGSYTCTASDANGCTATASTTITQPASAVAVSISSINPSCAGNDGSATATATGGTAPYTYLWSNGGNSQTINNLVAGAYTCTASDANGCTSTASVVLTQPSAVSVSISTTNVSCFGGSNGTATATASGGTVPFSYLWSNGATTASISNLPAGTYTCTATDAQGCTASASTTITQPASGISVVTSGTNVNCLGGSTGTATATASGGASPYAYAWSNGANTQTISNLTAGTYTCTATDANGCTVTGTRTVTQPATGLNVTTSGTNVTCFGGSNGSATANPSGGTTPYTYLWSNGGTTKTISNLAAGIYTVTVTNSSGCTRTATRTVTQPAQVTIAFSYTLPACFGGTNGSIRATPSGGTSPYTYLWSNGQTVQTATNLAAGNYTVTATSAAGCTGSGVATLANPPQLTITNVAITLISSGYRAVVTATGGTGSKLYRRSTGPGTWTAWGTSRTFAGLTAGTYTFQVQDTKLCIASFTTPIPVVAPPLQPTGDQTFAKNIFSKIDFQLAPNPTRESVRLIFDADFAAIFESENLPKDGSVEIRDAAGRLLRRENWDTVQAAAGWLELTDLPAGIFLVTLRAEGFAPVTRKLIVE